ncbi:MAG TPA: RluA family pseudouridine synthase [bacterium]|nr:RluA family pseudouridine synthase [bacterium]
MEKKFQIQSNEEGERIDKVLCLKLPRYSRKQIKNLLDGGKVLVNNRRVVIAGWQLESGDEVTVKIAEKPRFERDKNEVARTAQQKGATKNKFMKNRPRSSRESIEVSSVSRSLDKFLSQKKSKATFTRGEKPLPEHVKGRLKIYFEDKDLIVVEKPANMIAVSHKDGRGGSKGKTLMDDVRAYMRRKHRGSGGSFILPLHRLDAETSGVMIFALSNTGKRLERDFRDHSIRREYSAVVCGQIVGDQGVIKKALEKGKFRGGHKIRIVDDEEGKHAVTEFSVIERYGDATFVDIRVRTGRTHQIRVHMASIGHPIIGDRVYGEGKGATRFPRQALHAKILGFKHPRGGKKMLFKSPLPRDMENLIDALRSA